jgi:hypothetical protein
MVAQILGKKFLDLGHEVMISSRDITKARNGSFIGKLPSAQQWANENSKEGASAKAGTFMEAAKFGEILFNCTTGVHSIEALKSAGKAHLKNKILIDLANPLDFSKGMPPTLKYANITSLGESIQAEFPEVKVVKTLNTITAGLMIDPNMLQGDHDLFICGNADDAKKFVKEEVLKNWLGWKYVIDLGDITASRGMEMYLPLWLRLMNTLKTPNFNIHVKK